MKYINTGTHDLVQPGIGIFPVGKEIEVPDEKTHILESNPHIKPVGQEKKDYSNHPLLSIKGIGENNIIDLELAGVTSLKTLKKRIDKECVKEALGTQYKIVRESFDKNL